MWIQADWYTPRGHNTQKKIAYAVLHKKCEAPVLCTQDRSRNEIRGFSCMPRHGHITVNISAVGFSSTVGLGVPQAEPNCTCCSAHAATSSKKPCSRASAAASAATAADIVASGSCSTPASRPPCSHSTRACLSTWYMEWQVEPRSLAFPLISKQGCEC